jgi:hypothetical protein
MRRLPRVLVRLHTVEQLQDTRRTALVRRPRRLAGLAAVRRGLNASKYPALGLAAGDTGVRLPRCRGAVMVQGRRVVVPRGNPSRVRAADDMWARAQCGAMRSLLVRRWPEEEREAARREAPRLASPSPPLPPMGGRRALQLSTGSSTQKKTPTGDGRGRHTCCRPFPSKGRFSAGEGRSPGSRHVPTLCTFPRSKHLSGLCRFRSAHSCGAAMGLHHLPW